MEIRGTVRFPPGRPTEVRAVHITVRDVTEFDAPARTVAAVDLPPTVVPGDGLEVPFALDVDLEDGGRTYAVRAHADRSGSGEVERGDLVTTTAYVVRPGDPSAPVLELQPVG